MSEKEKRFPFSKRNRLSRKSGFSSLLKQPPQFNQWFAVYVIPNRTGSARLGMVVGKRLIKKSIHRNQIKRMIRENFRTIDREGIEKDVLVRLRRGLEKKDYVAACFALKETLGEVLCAK